jgi:hypothetical protein
VNRVEVREIMNSLMKSNRLLALLLGLLIFLPAPVAHGDGDGVGILPHYQNGDDDGPAPRVDGGGAIMRRELVTQAFAFLVTTQPDGSQTTTLIPVRGRFSWQRFATNLSNDRAYTGFRFAVGYVKLDVSGHGTLTVALVAGGSGKAPVIQSRRY